MISFFKRFYGKNRVFVITSVVLLTISVIIITNSNRIKEEYKSILEGISGVLVGLIIIDSASSLFKGVSRYVELGSSPNEKETFSKIKELERTLDRQKELAKKMLESSKLIENNGQDNISEEEKKIIIIESNTKHLQDNISSQIDITSRSGTINLLIGLSLTLIGITLLIIVVFFTPQLPEDTKNPTTKWQLFLEHIVPRLSIVVFVEFLSFFFLNLYKRNNDEVKYFNNERTNIQSKILALKMSVLSGDKDSFSKTIIELNKVDRNTNLKRGETTLELEKIKYEKNSFDKAVQELSKLGKVFGK